MDEFRREENIRGNDFKKKKRKEFNISLILIF
jgi:hypothetical protein